MCFDWGQVHFYANLEFTSSFLGNLVLNLCIQNGSRLKQGEGLREMDGGVRGGVRSEWDLHT